MRLVVYFSGLKYSRAGAGPGAAAAALLAALLAPVAPAAAKSETLFVPPIFEDFEGPHSLALDLPPSALTAHGSFKLQSLVPAGEVGEGSVTIRKLGLRLDGGEDASRQPLKGVVTLCTSPARSLRRRFAENAVGEPVTFFVMATASAARGGRKRPLLVFDLPGGFVYDPAKGSLLVHLELQTSEALRLDAAPAGASRLLVASDFLAPAGELLQVVPVLYLAVEREPRPHPPDLPPAAVPLRRETAPMVAHEREEVSAPRPEPPDTERQKPAAPSPPGARPARPGTAPPARVASASVERLAGLEALEEQVLALRAEVRRLSVAQADTASSLAAELRTVQAMMARGNAERALERGLLGPGAAGIAGTSGVTGASGNGELAAGRNVAAAAVAGAREAGFDVHAAEALLSNGDERARREDPSLAFLSYSLAYRAVLGLVPSPPPPGTPRLAESGRARSPYELSDMPQ